MSLSSDMKNRVIYVMWRLIYLCSYFVGLFFCYVYFLI